MPLGYPMFLSAIKTTIGLRWAGTAQMTLLVTTCTIVALSIHRMTGRWFTGILTLLLLLSHTEVFHLQGVLFSEALFIPLLIANIGAAVFLISTN
ncbi:MAG: hypothetical protein ABIL01_31155 [Pseudomonadota bacterium]